jgi:hypothetical protein
MSISEIDREEEINALGLPPVLNDLLLFKIDCGAFSQYFEKPHYFYSKGYPDNPGYWPELGERKLLPLWERGGEIYALDIISSNIEGISFYAECPEEFEKFQSIYEAIFKIIELHTWEFGGEEKEIEEAITFAKLIGLPNIQGLENLFCNYLDCTEEMIGTYKQTL